MIFVAISDFIEEVNQVQKKVIGDYGWKTIFIK